MRRTHHEAKGGSPYSALAMKMKTYLKMILVLLMNHHAGNAPTAGAVLRKTDHLEGLQPLLNMLTSIMWRTSRWKTQQIELTVPPPMPYQRGQFWLHSPC